MLSHVRIPVDAQCVKEKRPVFVDEPKKVCRTHYESECKTKLVEKCQFHEEQCGGRDQQHSRGEMEEPTRYGC